MTPDPQAAAALREARKLIETPEQWCQGHSALDARNHPASLTSRKAVKFCALGALFAASSKAPELTEIDGYLVAAIGDKRLTVWNDASHRQHSEVLAAFDAAIRLAEGE